MNVCIINLKNRRKYMNYDKIGEFIALKRKEKNLTQRDLAKRIGVTDKAVSRWERGETEPDVETIKKLCEVFACSLDDIIHGPDSALTKKKVENIHKGYLIGRTVYGCTYHELNHYWEAYCDLKQNGYYKRYYNQAYKSSESSNNAIDIFSNKTLNDLFNNILYRLFSETEFNALVSSVYGDLEAIYSKREDFKEDIKKTAAYVLYNAFSKNYKALYSYIDENNITKIKNLFNNLGITLNPYSNSVESFRKELTRKTNFLLKQLIKGIGRTASLYYDTMEEEISDNITIN